MRKLGQVIAAMVGAAIMVGQMDAAAAAFAQTAPSPIGYSDVKTTSPGVAAITELSALGIVQGVGGNSFDPSGKVTRAEFAKLLDNAIGLGPVAEAEAHIQTPFSDVSPSAWYDGYVAVAAGQGIVAGEGNGTFAPNNPVTYAEAVTMVVRALGYEPVVTGPWPAGYLEEASRILSSNGSPNLLRGITGALGINQPLDRLQTTELIANALYCQLASTQYTVGTSLPGQSVRVTPPASTLLGRIGYSGAYPGSTPGNPPLLNNYTGLVVATQNSDPTLLNANQIQVETPYTTATGITGYATQTLTAASTIGLIGATNLDGLLGTQISYVVNNATNRLVFADVTNAPYQILNGSAVVVNPNGENLGNGPGEVNSVSISVNNTTENIPLASPATVPGSGLPLPLILSTNGGTQVQNGDSLTVVLNAAGQAMVVLDQNTQSTNDLFLTATGTDLTNNDPTITADNSGSPSTFDIPPGATVTLNGKPATVSQLPTGAVVSFVELNGSVTQVSATTQQVGGVLTGISNSGGSYYLTIGGKQYQVSGQANMQINGGGIESFSAHGLVPAIGENVSAIVGSNGNLGYITATTGNLVYGLVTNPDNQGEIQLETTAGQRVDYPWAPTASPGSVQAGDYVEVVLNGFSQISQLMNQGTPSFHATVSNPAWNGNLLSTGNGSLLVSPNTPVFFGTPTPGTGTPTTIAHAGVGSLASVGSNDTIDYVTNPVGQVVEITVVGPSVGTPQTALVTAEATHIGTTSSSTLNVDLYGTTENWTYTGDASGWGSSPYVLVATVNGTAITNATGSGAETVAAQTYAGNATSTGGFNNGVQTGTNTLDFGTSPTQPGGLFVVQGTVTGTPNVGNNQYIQIQDSSGNRFDASGGNGFLVNGSTLFYNNSNSNGTIGLGNLAVGTNVELVGAIDATTHVATVWYVVDNG